MKRKFLLFLLPLLFGIRASSQILIPEINDGPSQYLFLNLTLEPEWEATLGYLHRIGRPDHKGGFYLGSSIEVAPLIQISRAWRFNFTQAVAFPLSPKWKTVVSNDFFIAHNKNRAGAMNGFGFELKGAAITTDKKWNKGVEAGWQFTAFTHIRHAKATKGMYREIYPEEDLINGPVNGWYGATASRIRLGFITQTRLGPAMRLNLSAGTLIAIQKQKILLAFPYAQVPVYFNTQITYSW